MSKLNTGHAGKETENKYEQKTGKVAEAVAAVTCDCLQASRAAFRHFIQVNGDIVWLILNDTYCPQSPLAAADLPTIHVIYL